MPLLMVIHPHHCETLDLADLLEALPPHHRETLAAWCSRTGTELEGDADALGEMFTSACRIAGGHFTRREPLVESLFLCQ